MAVPIIMDTTGDTRHEFDAADAGAVEKAKRRFKQLTGAGVTAAVRTAKGSSKLVRNSIPRRKRPSSFLAYVAVENRERRLAHFDRTAPLGDISACV